MLEVGRCVKKKDYLDLSNFFSDPRNEAMSLGGDPGCGDSNSGKLNDIMALPEIMESEVTTSPGVADENSRAGDSTDATVTAKMGRGRLFFDRVSQEQYAVDSVFTEVPAEGEVSLPQVVGVFCVHSGTRCSAK